MNPTPLSTPLPSPAAPSLGVAKALVLITRTTVCECGERYSSPELYERFTPPGHWNMRNMLHLKRRTTLPAHRLPIERHVVVEQIPFCDYCLALGAPLGALPLPPDPKASVGGLGKPPPTVVETKPPAKPAPVRRSPAMTLDDVFS